MSDIYLSLTETPTVVTLSQPVIGGALSSTVTVANTVTVALDANSLSALEQVTVTVGAAVSVSNFPATQVVSVSNLPAATTVTGTVALDTASLAALENVTVTVGGAVSVSNFPATQTIAGSVTVANFPDTQRIGFVTPGGNSSVAYNQGLPVDIVSIQSNLNPLPISGTVAIGSLPAVSGTVTASVVNSVTIGSLPNGVNFGGEIAEGFAIYGGVAISSLPTISGTVTVGALNVWDEGNDEYSQVRGISVGNFGSALQVIGGDEVNLINGRPSLPVAGTVTVGNSVTISSLPTISGTVTAAAPNGTLTTRFGSVTTANTAFATSAVTNASRKYLLIQNVTTSSNVITVGIGFTPTTTQGIQLTAGAGITFESSYIPTGAVYVLSSVTASNFTILEA